MFSDLFIRVFDGAVLNARWQPHDMRKEFSLGIQIADNAAVSQSFEIVWRVCMY